MLVGNRCSANTFPYIEVQNNSATMEHEATTSRISADQIFYLENGVLKETGNHTELMEKKGLYYSLYLQQEAAA